MQYHGAGCPGCEWDPEKDAENQRKHDGITLEDACRVFDDPYRDEVENEGNDGEVRFIATGRVGNVILVVFTERNGRERILSARKAEPPERRAYYARKRSRD